MGQARSHPVTPCHAPWDRVRRLPRLIDGGRWTRRNYTALDTSITVRCDDVPTLRSNQHSGLEISTNPLEV